MKRFGRSALISGAMAGIVASGLLAAGPAGAASAPPTSWFQVGAGSVNNISGLAAAPGGWVAIRDNKTATQNRIALIDDAGHATSLAWPGALPTDLESIDQIPGVTGGYAALASTGQGYLLQISGTTVTRTGTFVIPNAKSGIEAFALTTISASTVAVWATRGSTAAPAKVSAATFNLATDVFGKVVTGKVTVPYPTTSVRPVSDLKVIGGRLVISSASDPGNSGPFTSALYDVGTVGLNGAKAVLGLTTPVSLGQFAGHKIEGIACSGAQGLLGSDDEKGGGWILGFSFCSANARH
jgi:hypothetical protein